MDGEDFRVQGKEVIDYIVDYLENIRNRRVFPDKKPGFIRDLIPEAAPLKGEQWSDIFKDMETVIMPGTTHWQSPHMHAYFPALNSYPSMLGEMLTNAINCVGFTWASSPVCTELEMVVMNWLGKMIGLPEEFLHRKGGDGGGVIQTTASECTLISLLAGRYVAIKMYESLYPGASKHEINGKLVAYCSDQAHSSVEKAALIGLVTLRYVESDENYSMTGANLLKTIKKDRENGLIPFWVCATLGTTGSCAFDNLEEISEVCYNELVWCHVDAAYAGSAFICPEFRVWLKGIDKANSIAFNPSKWLMHWQIPLSKRFRSLKLWFVIRNYGITGLQEHIRKGVHLAEKFEQFVKNDTRFEIPSKRHLGLVVFRLKGDNVITETLCKRLNSRGNIHCVPASLKGKYVIRFTVTSPRTTLEDIVKDWKEIVFVTNDILQDSKTKRTKVPLGETRQNENFGSSLLLSNVPMSPKIVNASFAAIYDQGDVLEQFSKTVTLRKGAQDSPAMRRRIKGILMSGKQFSLDSRLDLFHGIETTPTSSAKTPDNKMPLLEDSIELDDPTSSPPEYDSEYQSSTDDCLNIPQSRHTRSKSVDHQTNLTINNCLDVNNICNKCGHKVPTPLQIPEEKK